MPDLHTFFSGTPQEFYSFITGIETFVNENKDKVNPNTDINTNLRNQAIRISKMGTIQIFIYEKVGNGYHLMLLNQITILREKFQTWCNVNHVKYNE